MSSKENWKPVNGCEGVYEVSDQGRVKAVKTGRVLNPYLSGEGHLYADLCGHNRSIHRMVYEAFFGVIPSGYVVHHVNHNPTDNRASNLVCISRKQHCAEHPKSAEARRRIGDAQRKRIAAIKDDAEERIFNSVTEAANAIGCARSTISNAAAGRQKTASGYKWKFV